MLFISDVQSYVPIKLCKTAGSIHLFKIKGTLKPENIKLNKNYLWDTLEIDWKAVTVIFNDDKIKLPKIVAIRLWDKIKLRRLMNREPLLFHVMIRQGRTWFTLETDIPEIVYIKNIFSIFFRMACILQPECNFLHSYFRCRLQVEVVDTEVNITSMEGTHIFRRDRMTQLIKCTPWSTRLCPHPMIVKKMKTFLEVEGKMGSIPQPANSQYRPPQWDTNPNIRKDKATEKRKRVVPPKRFRANTTVKPNKAAAYQPATVSKAPTNIKPQAQEGTPENRPPPLEDAPVHKSTPWPGAGMILGNLFEERKGWLLPPNYLDNNKVKDMTGVTSPRPPIKEEPKTEEQSITSLKTEVWMGTKLPLLQESRKRRRRLGWQLPKSAANTAPTEDSDAPSKVPPDSKLPETPELSETQS